MDYSVFFYTYSTIAQTLAGGFGVILAAVLYRLGRVDRIREDMGMLRVRRLQAQHQWETEQIGKTLEDLHSEYEQAMNLIINGLPWSGLWTILVIVTSIVMIPITPSIYRVGGGLVWLPVVIVIAATVYTLMTYYMLLLDNVLMTPQESKRDS